MNINSMHTSFKIEKNSIKKAYVFSSSLAGLSEARRSWLADILHGGGAEIKEKRMLKSFRS